MSNPAEFENQNKKTLDSLKRKVLPSRGMSVVSEDAKTGELVPKRLALAHYSSLIAHH